MLSKHSIKSDFQAGLGATSDFFFYPFHWVNPLQYVSECWERELTAILGYPVCSLKLRDPLLYEIFSFSSIHHSNRSLAVTPQFYFCSGLN